MAKNMKMKQGELTMLTREDEIKLRLFDSIVHGKNLSIIQTPLSMNDAIMYTNYVYSKLFRKEN